ncbi:hypothetical protein MLD38_019113 [Melastoma candidum]|uniref:Uncharacterized protein n=1 Tax=Melastoma candidum TaxID=119954 RepID=A0ACB9QZZ2_9MYRT|nr:hypothetical protein MLD38_019113 [Melastoma candidum]
MGRPTKLSEPSKNNKKKNVDLPSDPDKSKRDRLKSLAVSAGILSPAPSGSGSRLAPSRTLLKHDGTDIIKKSQRKNRFLFSFPGLIAPAGGGRIGELKDLGSKNPVLYMEFPQGQMKLFGTIVYPKNKYLTLQFSKGGKNVMCEDYFDAMVVFSDAWWIGKKEENPEEARLEFPKELSEGQNAEHDFTGGAGEAVQNKPPSIRTVENDTQLACESKEGDSLDTGVVEVTLTPVRQSARTAGNSIKYTEASSGSSSKSDSDESDTEKPKNQAESAFSSLAEAQSGDTTHNIKQDCDHTNSADQPISLSMSSMTKLKDPSQANQGSLVQARISTMFKKAGDKSTARNKKKSELATAMESGQKMRGSRTTRKD